MKVIKTKEIKVSKHCQYRGKQRVNVRGKAFIHLAIKAYKGGLGFYNTNSKKLKSFISMEYMKFNKKANNIKIYGHFVYIFKDNFLYTVLDLPENLWNEWDNYSRKIKAMAI